MVARVRSNRDFAVVVSFEPPPNIDDLDEVCIIRLDGLVVIKAEIASELGFAVVVFFLFNRNRLKVSTTSRKFIDQHRVYNVQGFLPSLSSSKVSVLSSSLSS